MASTSDRLFHLAVLVVIELIYYEVQLSSGAPISADNIYITDAVDDSNSLENSRGTSNSDSQTSFGYDMSSVGDESQGQGASQQKEEEDIYRRLPSIYQSSTQQQQQRPFQTKYKRLIDENALAGLTGRSKLIYIYRTDFGKRSADLDPASRFNNLDSKSSLWPLSISGVFDDNLRSNSGLVDDVNYSEEQL